MIKIKNLRTTYYKGKKRCETLTENPVIETIVEKSKIPEFLHPIARFFGIKPKQESTRYAVNPFGIKNLDFEHIAENEIKITHNNLKKTVIVFLRNGVPATVGCGITGKISSGVK